MNRFYYRMLIQFLRYHFTILAYPVYHCFRPTFLYKIARRRFSLYTHSHTKRAVDGMLLKYMLYSFPIVILYVPSPNVLLLNLCKHYKTLYRYIPKNTFDWLLIVAIFFRLVHSRPCTNNCSITTVPALQHGDNNQMHVLSFIKILTYMTFVNIPY